MGGPISLCVDREDRVWVSATNNRVQQFTNDEHWRSNCDMLEARREYCRSKAQYRFIKRDMKWQTPRSQDTQAAKHPNLRWWVCCGRRCGGCSRWVLLGPLGAAVGAVLGGAAGANARKLAESKPMKKLGSSVGKTTKNAVGKVSRRLQRRQRKSLSPNLRSGDVTPAWESSHALPSAR